MLSNEPFFESLRDLLAHLERIGKLQRIATPVDKDWEIACITRQVMYQRPDDEMLALWEIAVDETRALLTGSWGDI